MNSESNCPLTGKPGQAIRHRQPGELADCYGSYLGTALPTDTIERYFTTPITEYYLPSSGLRWYSPAHLGDGGYYTTLARIYPWYYNPGSWDKQTTLKLLTGTKATGVVEIGCGDGWLLAQLREHGLKAIGVEINPKEVESARKNGLSVFFPDEVSSETSSVDWLCLLQTIEHVENPVAFIKGYIDKFKPRSLIISAPCFESLLGFTKDPLSWPPHHATAWSKKAFETLGLALGFSVVKTAYSPLSYDEFCNRVRMEGANKLPGLPRIPSGRIGRYLFRAAQKIGLHWAVRGHSILVVMERNQ